MECFNFINDVFTIRHTVTACNVNGKHIMITKDKGKSDTSLRSLPLVPFMEQWLLEKKAEQEQNRKLCGRSYNKKYLDYLCVDSMGYLIIPNYVSTTFTKILKQNALRHIRFHDLHHSCAAILAAIGVGIEDIMAWLGHSDIKLYRTSISVWGSLQSFHRPNPWYKLINRRSYNNQLPLKLLRKNKLFNCSNRFNASSFRCK